jgi:hypothetical protein
MSRSSGGRLLGRAAQTQAREIREEIQMAEQSFRNKWDETLQSLEYFMGDGFESWWDSYPEEMSKTKFLPIMESKLAELDGTLQDTYARIDQIMGPEPIRQSDYDDLADIIEERKY